MDEKLKPLIPFADVIVHYSRGIPFRSITNVNQQDISKVVEDLDDENAWGFSRFSDPEYLKQRFEAENKLRRQFVQLGGRPSLRSPIYFFLGRNDQFEQQKRNIGYAIDLKEIDPSSVSYTYGDSMFCLIEENRKTAGSRYLNPLCEAVYTSETLAQLFNHPLFPKTEPLQIEVQLWRAPDLAIVKKIKR